MFGLTVRASTPRRREVRRDGRDGRADPLARARDVFANLADGATRRASPVHRRVPHGDADRGYGPTRRVQTLSRLVGQPVDLAHDAAGDRDGSKRDPHPERSAAERSGGSFVGAKIFVVVVVVEVDVEGELDRAVGRRQRAPRRRILRALPAAGRPRQEERHRLVARVHAHRPGGHAGKIRLRRAEPHRPADHDGDPPRRLARQRETERALRDILNLSGLQLDRFRGRFRPFRPRRVADDASRVDRRRLRLSKRVDARVRHRSHRAHRAAPELRGGIHQRLAHRRVHPSAGEFAFDARLRLPSSARRACRGGALFPFALLLGGRPRAFLAPAHLHPPIARLERRVERERSIRPGAHRQRRSDDSRIQRRFPGE
mmetsp:Transcript_8045/g.35581  ORF Transcript_8045/g.35581 Transcript_8045/m.35581 type:complete len:373 (+) Transcript_8045:754-1872(+)